MNKLKECKKIYDENFHSESWIEDYPWRIDTKEASFLKAKNQIFLASIKIFLNFSTSVLSGEYIDSYEEVQKDLDQIKDCAAHEEYTVTEEENDNDIGKLKNALLKQYQIFDKDILYCIKEYESLLDKAKAEADIYKHHYVLKGYYLPNDDIQKDSIFYGFATFVIPICKKDYNLSYTKATNKSPDDIGNIVYLWNELKNYIDFIKDKSFLSIDSKEGNLIQRYQDFYNILLNKCAFLLKKMLYVSGESEYSVDFKSYSIKYENITTDMFQELWEKFEHLHIGSHSKYRELYKVIKTNTCTYTDLILFTKYLKDNNGSLNQFNQIIFSFDELVKKSNSDKLFQGYAVKTIKNYLYNCRLSYILKDKSVKYEDVLQNIQEIQDIQEETGIRNFYPYRKAVQYIDNEIDKLFKKDESYKNKDTLSSMIDDLKLYLSLFRVAIDWCKQKHYYPFQLPYNECITQQTIFTVFIPSSFTRPIKYDILEDEYNKENLKVSSWEIKLALLEDKQSIQEIKQGMTQSERKYIEILGFFAAVMSFLFGTVNFLSESKSTKDFISLASTYGVILMLFISAIYFMTMPKSKSIKDILSQPRLWIFVFVNLLYIILLFCILK